MLRAGDRNRFAIEIGEAIGPNADVRRVDFWAADRWLTCDDNHVFVPSFAASVDATVHWLFRSPDLAFPFPELSAEGNHRRLVETDDGLGERFWGPVWGPTTDNIYSHFFRLGPDLFFTFEFARPDHHRPEERGVVHVAQFPENEFVGLLQWLLLALRDPRSPYFSTPSDWGRNEDPDRMLSFLASTNPSERKLRLLACSAVRRLWELVGEQRSRDTVLLAEEFADGLVTAEQLNSAYLTTPDDLRFAPAYAAHGLAFDAARHATDAARLFVSENPRPDFPPEREWAGQADLIRDIFHPFRRTDLDPAIHTPTICNLAQAAYDKRLLPSGQLDDQCLRVLADALEDAGCDDADLLTHLRNGGPHVRGCWAIDLLLGKQ